jgi:hypothetical protein
MKKWFIVIDGKQIGPAFDTKEEALEWAKKNLKKGA